MGNAKFHSSVNFSVSCSRPQRLLNNDLRCVLTMDDIRGTICCVMMAVLAVVCGFRGFDPMSFHADLWWTFWLFSECLSQILLLRSFVLHRHRVVIALLWNWMAVMPSWDTRYYVDQRSPRHGRRRDEVTGENYVMRSLMICTANQILFGWWSREEWDGRGM